MPQIRRFVISSADELRCRARARALSPAARWAPARRRLFDPADTPPRPHRKLRSAHRGSEPKTPAFQKKLHALWSSRNRLVFTSDREPRSFTDFDLDRRRAHFFVGAFEHI